MNEIETGKLYEMIDIMECIDFSNADTTIPYYGFGANKSVVGKRKDERIGNPITEFLGMRPKI